MIGERLETTESLAREEPFARLFPAAERRIEAVSGEPVVLVDFGFAPGFSPRLWSGLGSNRDWGFVA